MLGITKEDQLKKNKEPNPKRDDKKRLRARVNFLIAKKICQVCNESEELDYPHHAEFGWSKKDDRTMINICVDCHRHIHTKGFPIHGLNREDTIAIGWLNNEEFEDAN